MYFTIKYNVFNKYIINILTAINACKKVIWRWSKGGNFFIYVSYLTRENTLYFLNVNKYWHDRKRWEKEANIVKGARFCYCRIYHKFVNFIILNIFKVVKWKSCFILIWNRHGHECSRIWKLSGNFTLIQCIKSVEILWAEIYWGRLFLGPNLVSFNRAVVPLLELSFLTKSQKLTSA
jgi:hypothetical protein